MLGFTRVGIADDRWNKSRKDFFSDLSGPYLRRRCELIRVRSIVPALLLMLTVSQPVRAAGTVPLHQQLQACLGHGLKLIYSRQQVRGIRVPDIPFHPDAPLAEQLAERLNGTGLTLRLVPPDTWYLINSLNADQRRNPAEDNAGAKDGVETTDTVTLMEEIVVTSPRMRIERSDDGGLYVSQRELESRPVIARDVLRAVASLPGQISTGTGARQHTRGGATDEVLYYVDGARLIEPFHLKDFEALFSTLNPGVVGAVNVYSAGFPVGRGSRLAGVVDIELLKASTPFEGEIDLNLLTAAVSAGGSRDGLGNNWRWLVSTRRSTVDLLLDSAEHDYGRPMFNDEVLHVAGEGERYRWSAGVLSTNDELNLREAQIGEVAKADFHSRNVWANGSWTLNDRTSIDARILRVDVENEREGELDSLLDATGQLFDARRFDVTTIGTTVAVTIDPEWLLRGGVEASRQRGRFELDLATRYGVLGLPLQSLPAIQHSADERRSGRVFGSHLSLSRVVGEGLDVEFGVRHDYQDIDPVHQRVFSPRLQINWHAGDWSIYLHAGRYAQLQELHELDIDDGRFELSPVQRLEHYSLGVAWENESRWSAASDFWCRFSGSPPPRFENVYNRLVLLPELHADRVRFQPDRSRACGIDGHVRWVGEDGWSARAQYGVARTEESIDGHWQSRPWDIRHHARLFLQRETAAWNLLFGITWHSGFPRTGFIAVAGSRAFDDQRYAPYFALDLHVGRVWTIGRSRLELYFDANNLLDRENEAGTFFRSGVDGIESHRRQLLPIVPNAGIRIVW